MGIAPELEENDLQLTRTYLKQANEQVIRGKIIIIDNVDYV